MKRPTIGSKVFGIGFHKTATSSLAAALRILGYHVTGPDRVNEISSWEEILEVVDRNVSKYDAFQDNPYPIAYEYIDDTSEDAKFILTVRDEEEWIQSVVDYFKGETTPMREYIYGVGDPLGNESVYLERYRKHNQNVKEYFGSREDFLVLRITEGEGWDKLCDFLGLPRPPLENFPHSRKRDGSGYHPTPSVRRALKAFYITYRFVNQV